MEENLKRNFNLISLQQGSLNFAAISLDDRWPVQKNNLFHPEMMLRLLFCFKDTKKYRLINIKLFETIEIIFNVFVNRNWKKLTDSRKRAKTLADSRKSHHPIETLMSLLEFFSSPRHQFVNYLITLVPTQLYLYFKMLTTMSSLCAPFSSIFCAEVISNNSFSNRPRPLTTYLRELA